MGSQRVRHDGVTELTDDDEGSSDQYIFYYALLSLLSSHTGLPVISQAFWDFPDLSF